MDYTAKVYYKAPGLMRMEREGVTTVFDWTKGKVLGLMHEERFAFISVVADSQNPFHKDWLSELQQTVADEEAQAMGTRRIDGRELAGWRIQLPPDGAGGMDTLTVWADADTGRMVRAEFAGPAETMVFRDFRIGAKVDDELVSLTPPEGYTVQQTKFNVAEPSLDDVALLLRLWSTAYEGQFPPSLASHKFPADARKINWHAVIDSEQEANEARMAISRSFWLINSQGDWRYPGAGKPTGSADQVVFWMPDDQRPGRVQAIFGNFSVRTISESDLPAQQD
jgi:outer membrane lipoprotein-sorting protein